MKLSENENTEFILEIAGYQFPDLEGEPYDSDWLNITIRVKHPRGSWTATDPSLMTEEVADLIGWLEDMADGKTVNPDEDFTEPNLHFQLSDTDANKLRVYFDLECRPSWAKSTFKDEDELWVEFSVTPEILRNAAESLRLQLQKFPTRVGF